MPKETAVRLNLVNEVLLPNEYSDVSNGHIKVLVIPMQTRFLFLPDFVLTLTDGEAISRLMAHSTHGAKKEKTWPYWCNNYSSIPSKRGGSSSSSSVGVAVVIRALEQSTAEHRRRFCRERRTT
jgi:hypothetical protein